MQITNMLKCLTLILPVSTLTYSQTEICYETATGVYWPVNVKETKNYFSQSGGYKSYFNRDSLVRGGKTYYKLVEEYVTGRNSANYLREENGNVYIYDTVKQIEFLELSNNTTPGHTWEKYDKTWKYTVVDTNAVITTPYCRYTNLLNIKAEPIGKKKKDYSQYYNLFYKRGVGLVNIDIEGTGYSFLTVDKSLANVKNYSFGGCENMTSEKEKNKCTAEKINEFISKNFRYQGKIKKGKLVVSFVINEKGEVTDVGVKQPLNNAQGQMEEVLRIVQLMKFVPRYVNGKAFASKVMVPVSF